MSAYDIYTCHNIIDSNGALTGGGETVTRPAGVVWGQTAEWRSDGASCCNYGGLACHKVEEECNTHGGAGGGARQERESGVAVKRKYPLYSWHFGRLLRILYSC